MAQRKIIIIGASGHARVCLDILLANGKEILGFCDDDPSLRGLLLNGYPIFGEISEVIQKNRQGEIDFFVAIGNNDHRKNIVQLLIKHDISPEINIIHPSAIVSPRVSMGFGNFIAPGVIINTDTTIGNYTIINTGSSLDHDNFIHDFSQISPGCNVAGNVTIEEHAFLGTGTTVIPNKTIGSQAIIGAGAVVIDDIPPFSTAVGVPARVIKQRNQHAVSKGVVIIGASGHALVCMDILWLRGWHVVGLYDDDYSLHDSLVYNVPVVQNIEKGIERILEEGLDFFVGIGDNTTRERIAEIIAENSPRPSLNAIHPSATLSPRVTLGHGNFIAPRVVINIASHIGDYTIINTGATVGHEDKIHDFAQIGPGCNLAGQVTIGKGAFLGAGAVVLPTKTIGEHAIVGAGAVVINDIPPFCTAVGVPARIIKSYKDT